MIRPGEIYWADMGPVLGTRPVIVMSREDLNRGHSVVIVTCTSTRLAVRRNLPNCVPFQAGDFGLPQDCVAQGETVSAIHVTRLDLAAGPIGVLDDLRFRDIVRAVGDVIGSDCEPV